MHEKPWYCSALNAFIEEDVPRVLQLSRVQLVRDVQTVALRTATEGESFLTKTLPSLGKAYDLALQGRAPLTHRAFKRVSRRDARPAFLQALHKRVFDDSGWILPTPCTATICLTRQILLWFKKIEKGFTDESIRRAEKEIVSVDAALPTMLPATPLLGVAKYVVDLALRNIRRVEDYAPKHGPGAAADCSSPVLKRHVQIRYTDLERVFPPYIWQYSGWERLHNQSEILGRPTEKFGLSQIVLVEKDSSGPRVIGKEPPNYMWCQQAVKACLYQHVLEPGPLNGHVNFVDQTINRDFARNWQDWDTLDMSKASDRNSLALFNRLWCTTPVYRYLLASRTPGAKLPSGEILWYKKFAPMGSAVCFPVQAITYYALAVATLHLRCGMPLALAMRKVYVYGDDLIVPHGTFQPLDEEFQNVGLMFNQDKCCTHGKFRESCGLDAFDGMDVTPIRLKKEPTSDAGLVHVVEHANNLMRAHYTAASRALREPLKVHPLIRFIPVRDRELPTLSLLDLDLPRDSLRMGSAKTYTKKSNRVKGLIWKCAEEKSSVRSEERYLFESLAQRGSVGVEIRRNPSEEPTGDEFIPRRAFERVYEGKLIFGKRYRNLPLTPRQSMWQKVYMAFVTNDKRELRSTLAKLH